jgi:preprotein translocase subunit YajC
LTTFDLLAQTAPSTPTGPEATAVTTAVTPAVTTASTTSAAKPPQPPDLFKSLGSMVPIILMVIVFFMLMNRSSKKKDKGRTDMLAQLKKGDEVQTIGGILGKVLEAREDRVLVKVDESSNTKIWFSRTAIHRVVGADEVIK